MTLQIEPEASSSKQAANSTPRTPMPSSSCSQAQNMHHCPFGRTFNQVSRFFDGLELVEPGIVQCHRWHPEPGVSVDDYEVAGWGAVGRKP
jgi:hypothetical protein